MTTHQEDTPEQAKHGRRLTRSQRQICRREGLKASDGLVHRTASQLAVLLGCYRGTASYWMNKTTPESLPGPRAGGRKRHVSPEVAKAAEEYRSKGASVAVLAKALAEDFPEERPTVYQVNQFKRDSDWPHLRPASPKKSYQKFQQTAAGFIHLDTIVGPKPSDPVIFTARERRSRFAFAKVSRARDSKAASLFLAEVIASCPVKVHTIMTDNGSEFSLNFKSLAEEFKIDHRHTRPRKPQTNGHIERFNGQLKVAMEADNGWWHNGADRPSDREKCHLERFGTPLPDRPVIRMQRDLDRWLTWLNLVQPNRQIGWQTPLAWLQQFHKERPWRFQHHPGYIISTDHLQQITKGLRGSRYLLKPPEKWSLVDGLSIDL